MMMTMMMMHGGTARVIPARAAAACTSKGGHIDKQGGEGWGACSARCGVWPPAGMIWYML